MKQHTRFFLAIVLLYSALGVGYSQPTIATVIPAKNALNISASTSIQITFSEAMDQSTFIADSTINIHGSQSGFHTGVIIYDNGTFTATYNPTTAFKAGEVVLVTATTGIKNINGTAMSNSYNWSFTVQGEAADTFAIAVSESVDTNPRGITCADLNGDGHLDFATANNGSQNISVKLSNGNGTFAQKVNYSTGASSAPISITSADFDGDGDIDLVSVNSGASKISVFTNIGNGIFNAKVDYTTATSPLSISSSDLDGDGDIDLAVTGFASPYWVSVFLNNGNATFAAKADYTTGTSPASVTIADVDGDWDMDLAVANFGNGVNTVSILKNNGNGTFAAKNDYATGSRPFSITSADFDEDGDMDLATANNGAGANTVTVLKNNGAGVFNAVGARTDYPTGTAPNSVTAADFDGNGQIDLAISNGTTNNVSILKNSGSATFAAKIDYAVGTFPRYITSADLDGDGIVDLITANNGAVNNISLLFNTLSVPLPVELVSFTAISKGSSAELKWSTSTEVNNFGFEVERTARNDKQLSLNHWKTIGFIEGSGTSHSPKEYSFLDNNISLGVYAYRLKQIDHDGKFTYSQTLEVTLQRIPSEFTLAQNYPNPFNPATMIGYKIPSTSIVLLKIYDAIGREVKTLVNGVQEAGHYSASFNAAEFSSGIYFAVLQSDKKIQSIKMMLIK